MEVAGALFPDDLTARDQWMVQQKSQLWQVSSDQRSTLYANFVPEEVPSLNLSPLP